MSSDIVRVAGKNMTRARARALGFLDGDGNVLDTVPADSQAAKLLDREQRRNQWRKRQGLPSLDPETTEDGRLKVRQEPEPLRPQNVTKDGEPITDEETLAAIAARTAALEAERAGEAVDVPQEAPVSLEAEQAEDVEQIGVGEVATFLEDEPEGVEDPEEEQVLVKPGLNPEQQPAPARRKRRSRG